jgi:hypothetical protein
MADTKLTREARVRLARKRRHCQEQAIIEELSALPTEAFHNERFCGDCLIYSVAHHTCT